MEIDKSNSTIPDDSWTHLVARFNKTAIEIYVNGTLEATTTHDGVPYVAENGQIELKTLQEITSYSDIVIGATITADMASSAYNMFSGLIDGVQLFDHHLEPEDVWVLYHDTVPMESIPLPPQPIGIPQPSLRYRILNVTRAEEALPVSIAVDELNENHNQLTVSVWVRPNFTNGSDEFTVASKDNSWALSINKIISPEQMGKFSVFDGISWYTVTGSTPISGWTHLAGVFNNASLILYVNGTTDGKLDIGPPEIPASDANVTIGAYQSTLRNQDKLSNYFSGPIVDVTVYKYGMVDKEVHEEYQEILKVYLEEVDGITSNSTKIILYESLLVDAIGKQGEYSQEDSSVVVTENLGLSDKLTLYLNNQSLTIPAITTPSWSRCRVAGPCYS